MNLLPKNTDTSTVLELELAEKAGEYWNETSKHSAVQERLSAELVPASDEANSVHGMLLRAATRIYYDVYNNGGWNMVDNVHSDWLEEGDEDYEEPEYELVGLYKDFFDNLERFMPKEHQECVAKAKAQTLENPDSSCIVYDHLVDRVIHTILTTTNIVHESVDD